MIEKITITLDELQNSLVVAGSGAIIGPEKERSVFIDMMGSMILAGIPQNMMSLDTWKSKFNQYEGNWQQMWQEFIKDNSGREVSKKQIEQTYKSLWAITATNDRLPPTTGIYELITNSKKFGIVSGQSSLINKIVNEIYKLGINNELIIETVGNSKEEVDKGYRRLLNFSKEKDVIILDGNSSRIKYIEKLKDSWLSENICDSVKIVSISNQYEIQQKNNQYTSVDEFVKNLGIKIDKSNYNIKDVLSTQTEIIIDKKRGGISYIPI